MELDRLEPSLAQQLHERWLDHHIEIHPTIASTNKLGIELAEMGHVPAIIVADEQTEGMGRYHRSFYSPAGTGLYLSLVIEEPFYSDKILLFTPHVAVALVETITQFLPYETPEIKWVNDVYLHQRKIAGILVQAQSKTPQTDRIQLVIGIGVNLYAPKTGFPTEIEQKAGAIFNEGNGPTRDQFVITLLEQLEYWLHVGNSDVCSEALRYYRAHQFLMNKVVTFDYKHRELSGYVTGITDQYALVVQDENGNEHHLNSGEVHIKHFD
ncbi:MAG: biotin--[acetyl-CoA-carboxylase] ligase [Aerococcus sp.]|nr:biotin--[acetyl-CoA-carboxylase] ligase [Aerococcus sp.]